MSQRKKKKQKQQTVSASTQDRQQRDYVPTKEELINEQIINLVCEVCIFNNEHCYCGMYVENPDEVKEMFTILKNLQPGKFTTLTVMAAYEIWGRVFSQLGGLSADKDDPNFPVIQEIKRLSSIYGTGYILPAHDALATKIKLVAKN